MENNHYLSQEDYDKGVSLMIRFCVDFIVVKERKVLLLKRTIEPFKGLWHMPGGMVQKGETVQEAADRILLRELGVKPKEMQLLGYCEIFPEEIPSKNMWTHSVSLVFKTTLDQDMKPDNAQFFSEIPNDSILSHKKFIEGNWSQIAN
jgi:ADP-ribose pyrophosphatase YjhB (NUDIX family)